MGLGFSQALDVGEGGMVGLICPCETFLEEQLSRTRVLGEAGVQPERLLQVIVFGDLVFEKCQF